MKAQDGSRTTTLRRIRIFFASSSEMFEERSGFAVAIRRLGELPGIRRNYLLEAVLWETGAYGGVFDDINKTIQAAVNFDHLDIVVIGFWNRIGAGTQEEYQRARSLYKLHRRPHLLVFARNPLEGAEQQKLDRVKIFKRTLIDEGVVPNQYGDPEEFFGRLEEQIANILAAPDERIEPTTLLTLRKRFLTTAVWTTGFSVIAITVCRVMTNEYGMDYWKVLLVLASPIILSLSATLCHWYYHRLLTGLKRVWHSPSFKDEELYDSFRDLVPRFAVPQALDIQFRQSPASLGLTLLLLALVFLSPLIAQRECLFKEMSTWHFAVGHDVVTQGGRPLIEGSPENWLVRNKYVDERSEGSWPFSLQDSAVRAKYEAGHEIIYVYAQGKFSDNLPVEELFRRNLGPQVFLPQQFLIYLALLIANSLATVLLFFRLARFSRELQTVKMNSGTSTRRR